MKRKREIERKRGCGSEKERDIQERDDKIKED